MGIATYLESLLIQKLLTLYNNIKLVKLTVISTKIVSKSVNKNQKKAKKIQLKL